MSLLSRLYSPLKHITKPKQRAMRAVDVMGCDVMRCDGKESELDDVMKVMSMRKIRRKRSRKRRKRRKRRRKRSRSKTRKTIKEYANEQFSYDHTDATVTSDRVF